MAYSVNSTEKILARLSQKMNWHGLSALAQWVIDQAIDIQQIAAPTFDEAERATYVKAEFAHFGLEDIQVDDMFNVCGVFPGQLRDAPGVMIAAHTDTVFPAETDLKVQRESKVIYGPGLGDNSLGVAALLGVLHHWRHEGIEPLCDVWFVATSREEGLGDLGGMRVAYDTLGDKIGAVINLEGLALGHVYNGGIAVRRLHITAKTDGGHSWTHFGRPSAIHGIMNLGAKITHIEVQKSPRTTYNIGIVDGGQSINSIAAEASLWLDMRAETKEALAHLEQQVQAAIAEVTHDELQFAVEVVGDRPAGMIEENHPLVQMAMSALRMAHVQGSLQAGSTDGNVPLSHGCPTVTIGITRGGNAHRVDEYIETQPVAAGMKQLLLLSLATCEWMCENI